MDRRCVCGRTSLEGRHGNVKYCDDCRPVAYQVVKEWREANPARLRDQRRRYRATDAGRAKGRRDSATYKLRHPDKLSAQRKLQYAILTGKMARGDRCESCALVEVFEPGVRFRIHAHHADYTKPYAVQWLCERCHAKLHN